MKVLTNKQSKFLKTFLDEFYNHKMFVCSFGNGDINEIHRIIKAKQYGAQHECLIKKIREEYLTKEQKDEELKTRFYGLSDHLD